MALFGKQFQSPAGGDAQRRLAALEEHIRYMQEMLEFNARQTEKTLGDLKNALQAAEKTAE